jgi:hypothetical protein
LVATSKPSDPAGPVVRQNLAGEDPSDAAEQGGAAELPPPITEAAEPEAVIFQRRQDVQAQEAPQVPHAEQGSEARQGSQAAAPEPLTPQASEAPVFERLVEVPEESKQDQPVPAAEAASATQAQELEPQAPEAPVFERRLEVPDEVAQDLPVAPAAASPHSPAPVFERSIQDHHAAAPLPAALDPAQQDGESAVDRFLRERRLVEQAQQGEESVQGPLLERSMQDRFVPLPPATEGTAAQDGPVFQRAMADRSVEAAPAAFTAADQVIAQAPREGSRRAPALEPVPLEQAQQIITEAAQETQTRVEEAIGAADGQWAEMDFPARVVKLKIENDKVRAKLDEIEQMADQHAQQMANQQAR